MNSDIKDIVKILKKSYPVNKSALNYKNPLQLLVATILSAQCTDVMVNKVTPALFAKYKTAKDYAKVQQSQFELEVRTTGFYRNKSKNIIACAKEIDEKYNGEVPRTLEELTKLPGIGRKTANVILGHVFGVPGIVVDTHVIRLSYRMGLTKNKDPLKIEQDLMEIIPKKTWTHFSNMLIYHGRAVCAARRPKCDKCQIEKYCPKCGV